MNHLDQYLYLHDAKGKTCWKLGSERAKTDTAIDPWKVDLPAVPDTSLLALVVEVSNLESVVRANFQVPETVTHKNSEHFSILLSRTRKQLNDLIRDKHDITWIDDQEIRVLYEFYKKGQFAKLLTLVENLCREANSCCTMSDELIDLNDVN